MHVIRDSKIDREKLKGCLTEITERLYLEMLKFGMELNNYTVDVIYKRFNNGELSYYVRAMLTKDKNMKKEKRIN